MSEQKALSVSALNRYLAARIDHDQNLHGLLVKGEITNCKAAGNTLYFTLSDEASALRAIMFPRAAFTLSFMPHDGMKVIVEGDLNLYVAGGSYSLVVSRLHKDGAGDAHQALLMLKRHLEQEGLFASSTKKPLPARIRTIGIVTSPTGDALHDITSTVSKRFPFVTLVLYPAKVQGIDAPRSLVSALKAAYRNPHLDCLLLARGGGSDEDLAAFNDEALARTIHESPIPLVSGIGHEADVTIADLVADLRAPTPTGAAVLVTPDRADLLASLDARRHVLAQVMQDALERRQERLEALRSRLTLASPAARLDDETRVLAIIKRTLYLSSPLSAISRAFERCNRLKECLARAQLTSLVVSTHQTEMLKSRLKGNDPKRPLERGYALVYQDGKLLKRAAKARLEASASIRFADGSLNVDVKSVNMHKEK